MGHDAWNDGERFETPNGVTGLIRIMGKQTQALPETEPDPHLVMSVRPGSRFRVEFARPGLTGTGQLAADIQGHPALFGNVSVGDTNIRGAFNGPGERVLHYLRGAAMDHLGLDETGEDDTEDDRLPHIRPGQGFGTLGDLAALAGIKLDK